MSFIDISFWNGTFNWNLAVRAGVEAAYIKVSEGKWPDVQWATNKKNCLLKWRGGYHFLDYANYIKGNEVAWGQEQARFFVNQMAEWEHNLPGVLDIESNESKVAWGKIDTSSAARVLKIALAFVQEYEKLTGHKPMIYTNSGLAALKVWNGLLYQYAFKNFIDCPLWVANYNNVQAPPTGAWSTYALWQYGSTGDGLALGNEIGNTRIDLNRLNMPIEQLAFKSAPTSEDEPVSEEDDPVGEATIDQVRAVSTVNIRTGAGISFPQLFLGGAAFVLYKGDIAEVYESALDNAGNRWHRIGYKQWVCERYNGTPLLEIVQE